MTLESALQSAASVGRWYFNRPISKWLIRVLVTAGVSLLSTPIWYPLAAGIITRWFQVTLPATSLSRVGLILVVLGVSVWFADRTLNPVLAPRGLPEQNGYDWRYDKSRKALRVGDKVLFQEYALFPDLDEPYYARNRALHIPRSPFATSPRGFVQVNESDFEWVDPRDRNRRIVAAEVREVQDDLFKTKHGTNWLSTGIVVDVIAVDEPVDPRL